MSDIANELYDTASRIFGDHCAAEIVNSAEAGVWPTDLWKTVEEAGLCDAPLIGDWQDACAVLRAASYANAPLPLADTMLGRHLLNAVGIAIPDGPLSFVVANDLKLAISNDGQVIDGVLSNVSFGSVTDHIVIVTQQENSKTIVVLLSTKSAQTEVRHSIAGEWLDNMTFVAARVSGSFVIDDSKSLIERYHGLGALTRSALITGAGKKTLELSLQYSSERVQFGRPIVAFQAVAFLISQITEEVAALSAIVEAAAVCDHNENAQQLLIAAAKTRAGQAATTITRMSHQIFGAMGITMEHTLNLSTRRIWAWREEYGGEHYWARTLGQCMSARTKREGSLWQVITTLSIRQRNE
jgi:acyl-CoA dehydrogenase